jgi:pilus assembly protein CpaF
MPDGSRINVIVPPLSVDGTCLTIRKFKKEKLSLSDLVEFNSMSQNLAEFIKLISGARLNVLISGGTGAGKTTLLNCLAEYISASERIITTEDVAELQLNQTHVVRLETRPPNIENEGEITMRQLIKNCLRMRPDRIIVGEVRGAEAFDLLQAMNTGHDGSMGTIHANSTREALGRLASLVLSSGVSIPLLSVREMIALAVDVVIQIERLPTGERKVTQISEVVGLEDGTILTQDYAIYDNQAGDWHTEATLSARVFEKLVQASSLEKVEGLLRID